jgi:CubicO group peptidase (beta-lactamase class C family)
VAAVDRAFAETPNGPYQDTKAVIIVHNDRIIAERYAAGYGPDTPMQSWSMAKSITNAMVGVLVREGRLSLDGPAPVAAWRDPADPRHAVTIDQLLRQTSGQPFGSAGSGFGKSARMQFMESDTAAFAAAARFSGKPGENWSYTDANYAILSGIIRDTLGGKAEDVVRFARREIFAPAGMTSVVQEFDEAGAPMGGSYVYATPRDWVRFALLYLRNGAAGERQVLPKGWAAYSAQPTAQAWVGYGAGFWTNLGSSKGATLRRALGAPADSFFADGDFGQHVLIVPSEHLIVARLGFSQDREGIAAQKRISVLAGEVVRALQAQPSTSRSTGGHESGRIRGRT